MLYTLLLGDRSETRGKGEPASAQEVKRDRGWIVRLIRDGTRSEAVSGQFSRGVKRRREADKTGLELAQAPKSLDSSGRYVPYQLGYTIPASHFTGEPAFPYSCRAVSDVIGYGKHDAYPSSRSDTCSP